MTHDLVPVELDHCLGLLTDGCQCCALLAEDGPSSFLADEKHHLHLIERFLTHLVRGHPHLLIQHVLRVDGRVVCTLDHNASRARVAICHRTVAAATRPRLLDGSTLLANDSTYKLVGDVHVQLDLLRVVAGGPHVRQHLRGWRRHVHGLRRAILGHTGSASRMYPASHAAAHDVGHAATHVAGHAAAHSAAHGVAHGVAHAAAHTVTSRITHAGTNRHAPIPDLAAGERDGKGLTQCVGVALQSHDAFLLTCRWVNHRLALDLHPHVARLPDALQVFATLPDNATR
mmetsp:Transcript_86444/g.241902  ORF Transcript_86444/g.241902 Transcript_86444/m.241902 type:complete len:287 (-) Transcript_86444:381-1241(-)